MTKVSRILNIILIFIFLSVITDAKDFYMMDKSLKVQVNTNFANTGTHLDKNSEEQSTSITSKEFRYYDEVTETDTLRVSQGFEDYEYSQFFTNFNLEYKVSNELIIKGGLDFNYYTLSSVFEFQDTLTDPETGEILKDIAGFPRYQNRKIDGQSYNLTQLRYVNLGTEYMLINEDDNKFLLSLLFKIPTSFNESLLNNEMVFLNDGALHSIFGGTYIYKGETTDILAKLNYIGRAEEFSDQFNFGATVYFTKIKEAEFLFGFDYLSATETIPSEYEFDVLNTPLYSSYLNIFAGLDIRFSDLELGFRYSFMTIAKDSWLLNTVGINIGYYLN